MMRYESNKGKIQDTRILLLYLLISTRLPISEGIVPVISLSANHKFCNFVHKPISAGTSPRKLFKLARKLTIFVKPSGPAYSGWNKLPSILFDSTSNVSSGVINPREVGIGPDCALKNEM